MTSTSTSTETSAGQSTGDVLQVGDLRAYYGTARGTVRAVNGVSFSVGAADRFGLVGESGSGKSTIALALMRLLKPPGYIAGGRITLDGVDLVPLSDEAMRRRRLAEIAMVTQGAINSLNPVARVSRQLADGMADHGLSPSRRNVGKVMREILAQVNLPPDVADAYPHQLSGGMRQRVCIAIAISLQPKVIIADEPTSALDVVVQRQVMSTLGSVQTTLGAAVVLIGHDIGLMAQFVHRIGVMYAGQLVEICDIGQACHDPLHPYTQLLLASLTTLERKEELRGIPGLPPSLIDRMPGCPFQPRCPRAMERCASEAPALRLVAPGRQVACHLY